MVARKLLLQLNLQEELSGSNSVVECQLPKLDVAGSSPVSRSKINNLQAPEKYTLHSPPLSITRAFFALEPHW